MGRSAVIAIARHRGARSSLFSASTCGEIARASCARAGTLQLPFRGNGVACGTRGAAVVFR